MEKGKLLSVLKYAQGKVRHPDEPASSSTGNGYGYYSYPTTMTTGFAQSYPTCQSSEQVLAQAKSALVVAELRAERIKQWEDFNVSLTEAIEFLENNSIVASSQNITII